MRYGRRVRNHQKPPCEDTGWRDLLRSNIYSAPRIATGPPGERMPEIVTCGPGIMTSRSTPDKNKNRSSCTDGSTPGTKGGHPPLSSHPQQEIPAFSVSSKRV